MSDRQVDFKAAGPGSYGYYIFECERCGELYTLSAEGLNPVHQCHGPTMNSIRRIVAEEIKAALAEEKKTQS
jgi:hypothetical protein